MRKVPNIEPRWLKVKEAALYSSLGVKRLKRLAGKGEVIGFSDPTNKRGDWIFDRLSLDNYRKAQAGQDVIATAILDVTERMNL